MAAGAKARVKLGSNTVFRNMDLMAMIFILFCDVCDIGIRTFETMKAIINIITMHAEKSESVRKKCENVRDVVKMRKNASTKTFYVGNVRGIRTKNK